MIRTLRKILPLITPQESKKAYWLLLTIMIMGLLETTSIASIMPFMNDYPDCPPSYNRYRVECNTYSGQGGGIVASGNYQELIISCEEFRKMTKHTTS